MIFEQQKSDLVSRQLHTQPTPAPRVISTCHLTAKNFKLNINIG